MDKSRVLQQLNTTIKLIFAAIVALCLYGPAQANTEALVSRIGDATHLEFSGRANWKYEVNQDGLEVTLTVPELAASSQKRLMNWKDELLLSIKVKNQPELRRSQVVIRLADQFVESFDYLTDQPSRLIVDFYRDAKRAEKFLAEQKKKDQLNKKVALKKKKLAELKALQDLNPADRKPSSELRSINPGSYTAPAKDEKLPPLKFRIGVYDGSDPNYNRFRISGKDISQEAIIASRQKFYIPFPIVEMSANKLEEILSNAPIYDINPEANQENKEARLLLELFKRKRHASYIKTLNYFLGKYPDSKYSKIVRYMGADVHYQMWQNTQHPYHLEEAKKRYSKLLLDYPKSPLADRTRQILNYTALAEGNGVTAVQNFLDYIKKNPNSVSTDEARFAMAEGYILIKRYDKAKDVYQHLVKSPQRAVASKEATYRLGDIDFYNGKYDDAVNSYLSALKTYPEGEEVYPNAHFNLGESYFWSGKYKQALDHYIRFLELFPAHDHDSYAMTRIGEVLEILGADEDQVVGAFIESSFRFPDTMGGKLARVRLLAKRMPMMKKKEMDEALDEFAKIRKESDIPKVDEFVTLTIAEGYRGRAEYEKAIQYLAEFYQQNPSSLDEAFFRKRIVNNIADNMKDSLERGDYFAPLAIRGNYKNTWLRNHGRIDVEYFLGRAYESAGVFGQAEIQYSKVEDQLNRIKGTQEQKEREVIEYLPNYDQLHLRAANIKLNRRKYGEALRHINQIASLDNLEPAERLERIDLAVRIYDEQGNAKRSIKNLELLLQARKDDKAFQGYGHLKRAELLHKDNRYGAAVAAAEVALSKLSEEQVDERAKAMEIKAESLLKDGQSIAAAETLSELLKNYEGSKPLGRARYQLGQVMFDQGDTKGAERVWAKLNPESAGFYKKLADEQLKNVNWESEYKKYIDRIPAMSTED